LQKTVREVKKYTDENKNRNKTSSLEGAIINNFKFLSK